MKRKIQITNIVYDEKGSIISAKGTFTVEKDVRVLCGIEVI